MFIKTTKSGKYEYAQLVESYRENGATRHRVMLNLGRLDQIRNNPSFQRMAQKLAELSAVQSETNNLEDIEDAEIFNYGYLAYRRLWEKFSLPTLLADAAGKAQFDLDQACFLMAVQHLLDPRSKRGTHARQFRYFRLPQVELHHLYRALDILERSKERFEEALFNLNRNLFNMQVDVVFFDVTTFHFESVRRDSLKDFGFSKNGKFNEVQVVLGLLIDRTGRPVGYELFPGHTFDGNTLELALESLEKRFGIHRVIIVADRGINSKLNLKRILEKGYGYIVASRLKKMPEKILELAFDSAGYCDLSAAGEPAFGFKALDYVNRFKVENQVHTLPEKLIVTYSDIRAQKDKADRERFIEKAKLLLKDKARIKAQAKRGGKKYLKEVTESSSDWALDEAAILKDARFDGYYAVQTSEENLSPQEVLEIYHDLWKIEESFRVMKSTLEVRPVFHWTEPRIKGHFVLCFLAFLMERTLEFKLNEAGLPSSPEQIREALNSLNYVEVTVQEKKFLIKTKALSLAHDIWRLLRLRPPKNVTPSEEM
jgi:transposase